jgi:RNA polymerase nonessential primary-like sigma factor
MQNTSFYTGEDDERLDASDVGIDDIDGSDPSDESSRESGIEAPLNSRLKPAVRSRSQDLVRLYLQEIGRVPLLGRDEEVAEAQKVQRYMQLVELRTQAAEKEDGLMGQYLELMNLRDRLAAKLGHRPSLTRWARDAKLEVPELKKILAAGKQGWAKISGLTVEELDKIQNEGIRAKEHMIKANLRLVVSVAKKYQNRGLELLDLVQEGTLGLERSVEKFDPTKGYRLVPMPIGGFAKGLLGRSPPKAVPFACRFILQKNSTKSKKLKGNFPKKKAALRVSRILLVS